MNLPPANEVWSKVILSQACAIPSIHEGVSRGKGKGVCIQKGFESRRVGLGRSPFGYYGIWSTRRRTTGMRSCFYHLRRSWGKVMFLHVSVILFTGGGVSASVHAGIHTHPGTGLPREQTPRSSACWEIRATSGRYASCYNAYLFFFLFSVLLGIYIYLYIFVGLVD